MSHPTKRKAPLLSPERLSKGVSGNPDGRPEKKGKWGDRLEPPPTLPTSTRKYYLIENIRQPLSCNIGYLPFILGGLCWRGEKSFENVVVL